VRAFWEEFRRRNVFRVGAAYLAVAWLFIQLVANLTEMLQAPSWIGRATLVLVVIGFPVALVLAWLFEPGAAQGGATSAPSPLRHRLNVTIVTALALAVAFLLADKYLIGAIATASAPLAATPTRTRLPHSVAVLPPRNESPDPKDAGFAGGMQDEIIDRLGKLKALTVIARTSTMRYANTEETIQQIGEELNVESVMESSVSYANDRVRIVTRLIDAINGKALWGETYSRDFKDIFAVQADIAMSVANALDAAFSSEEQRQVEKVPTTSSEAYRLSMQIRELISRGNESAKVITLARQAIDRDPNFAPPYSYLAYTYASLLNNSTLGPAGDPAQLEPLVNENAKRALELDKDERFALQTLGDVEMFHWRWTSAQRYYDDYLKVASASSGSVLWFLSWSGQGERAIEAGKKAVARDPNNWTAHWYLAWVHLYGGHDEEALAEIQRATDLAPTLTITHGLLAWAEIARGHNDAALRELQQVDTLVDGNNRSIIVLLDLLRGFSRLGRQEDVNRLVAELQKLPSDQDIGIGGRATVYLAQGEEGKALEELRRGVEHARNHMMDPGFLTLMNLRMNLSRDPVLERPEFVDARSDLRGD
jgi:serine/threonine-protein kinase